MCSLISPDAADAASSRVGAEPAGKPAIPVSRAGWFRGVGGCWTGVLTSRSTRRMHRCRECGADPEVVDLGPFACHAVWS
ncbi:hypothetical protein [Thiohalocapsa sp. ML1]|uniref:hypothetical protein n=1 Tax=Thiohalocapsa sp. ML1 TaxID=1431688 RepID=UPI00138F33C3|nr:hypothetical protein [Thiohalocapsa sp. ML1]